MSRHSPVVAERVSTSRLTRITADVAIPLGVGQAVARREYFDPTGFVAAPTLLVGGLCAIERCCDIAQRGDGVMKGGLVGFDLSDQMNAGGGGLLECFF